MVQTIPISENITTLNQVQARFNLRRTENDQFFTEWFADLSPLTDQEQELLDRIKRKYVYQRTDSFLSEETIKLVVLSPLLDLAGFYEAPFRFQAETPIEIAIAERDEVLRGRIDALVLQNQFWVLVIEAKRTTFDLELAIPQALTYMMANPHPEKPLFALVTNGGSFAFMKLAQQEYDLSDVFSLLPRQNKLYEVLSILKRIGNLIAQG
jgi:hypothetical protein